MSLTVIRFLGNFRVGFSFLSADEHSFLGFCQLSPFQQLFNQCDRFLKGHKCCSYGITNERDSSFYTLPLPKGALDYSQPVCWKERFISLFQLLLQSISDLRNLQMILKLLT